MGFGPVVASGKVKAADDERSVGIVQLVVVPPSRAADG
jgi:hypothetical protein